LKVPVVSVVKHRIVGLLLLASCLSGCSAAPGYRELLEEAPVVTPPSPTAVNLEMLPPPKRKIDVAIYQFPDLTGKNEPNDNVAVFSRAVTQGGAGLAVDALQRAGSGKWFTIVERNGLNNLLQERQLIRATRAEYDKDAAKPLPPIRFAGLIIEGGILTFDANYITGGIGANFLGIGGDVKFRRDIVTVGMRTVSVQSGEVLVSVTTTKTVYSVALTGNTYKFVAVDKLLQAEAGITKNEPTQLAVRQAIDLAVYSTIMEGARKQLWRFDDLKAQDVLIRQYLDRDKPQPLIQRPDLAFAPEVVVQALN
jgi:curli production assembly/transport component CsgG